MIRRYRLSIGGRWISARRFRDVLDPYTGRTVARVPQAGWAEADRAVAAAARAFEATRAAPAHFRAAVLESIEAGIRARRKAFVEAIVSEAGKPVAHAEAEVERALFTFRTGAEEAKRIGGTLIPTDLSPRGEGYVTLAQRVPVGPILAITPFNFPLNLLAHKAAPAIAAGCPLVVKPPPQAPGCAFGLAGVVAGTGWPAGAFQVVSCSNDIAERLAADDRFSLLSFTGSAEVGWRLKAAAGKKRVVLELGGNAGMLIASDADLDWAAQRAASGGFAYAGQTCISVQRIYCEAKIHAPFLRRFLAAVRRVASGDPRRRGVENGPLIDSAAAARVLSWIDEARRAGAKVLAGGRRLAKGRNVIAPTVLTGVDPSLKLACEEAFGPVVLIEPVRDFDEGLRRLDATRYGLQAAVFTRDIRKIDRANRFLRVGGLIVNDGPTFRMDNSPYGGTRESGLGREGVRPAIEEMTESRLLVVNLRQA